ncbi:MAG TPA: translation initiation factor IF-2 [bacterium]|nr:translation initiation factor IF-2 [bacterium]
MKVHELARELGLTSKELIAKLEALKVPVRNHMSVLDDSVVEHLRKAHAGGRESQPGSAGTSAGAQAHEVRGTATAVDAEKVRQSAFLQASYGSEIRGVRVIRAPRVEATPAPATPAHPPAAPGKPSAAPTPSEKGPVKSPAKPADRLAAKKTVEVKPDAKRTSLDTKPVHPERGVREHPAAAAGPAGAQAAAAPSAPTKDKPTVRFADVRKVPRYEPQVGEGTAMPRLSPETPAVEPPKREPAKPEAVRPVEVPRVAPEPPPPAATAAPQPVRYLELDGPIQVGELAVRMGVPPGEVVKRLVEAGVMAGINHMIPLEIAGKVMGMFNFAARAREVAQVTDLAPTLEVPSATPAEKGRDLRPPVVTVMGHVDHGKTSLLDAIRKTSVASQEYGGITQHIGAYTVEAAGKPITFLDTPGHEAFTALRARGAHVTDIAVLVVAADDGVMPQTIEAINHAKAARVPIIVAVNKIDLAQINPDRVKQQLADLGLVPEEWGGDTITVPVSARQGTGLDALLEMILLVAELRDLRATPDKAARATVIEARLDKGRGPVATILVQDGTLRVGDAAVVGETYGRIRAMTDDKGARIQAAGPSVPVEAIGLSDVPQAGDLVEVVSNERIAKAVAEERSERRRATEQARVRQVSVEEISKETGAVTESKELRLIVKGDVQGSVEALVPALERLTSREVIITILHAGVGNVTESDVMLAAASFARVIGFNVRPEPPVRRLAETQGVDVRLYRVIYEVLDDVKKLSTGLLAPEMAEVILGRVEVRKVYSISRIGTIAGCYVTSGKIVRGAKARLIRDGAVVHEGVIGSLRRFKDDVREVVEGFECGIGLERYNDIKEGDTIEAFAMEVKPA